MKKGSIYNAFFERCLHSAGLKKFGNFFLLHTRLIADSSYRWLANIINEICANFVCLGNFTHKYSTPKRKPTVRNSDVIMLQLVGPVPPENYLWIISFLTPCFHVRRGRRRWSRRLTSWAMWECPLGTERVISSQSRIYFR